jgi:pyruvate,water dikinase
MPLETDPAPLWLPLDAPVVTLATAGGKGANLARLVRAGFPVPPGFILTTAAYRRFVDANAIGPRLPARVLGLPADQPAALEAASAEIRAWFAAGAVPAEIAAALAQALARLPALPVAVRSSATAEDLPELSFAGQQETYLNVIGAEAVLAAVVRCWSSLWTARALGYRARNAIASDEAALAVVLQAMVPSEAAGVLFTADPLTGLRTRTVIDATLGLGEALVSGLVEPDHYEVDTAASVVVARKLGAKALALHGRPEGGVEARAADAHRQQALPDEQILALADLGRRVAAEFGAPQDIEWAWAGGRLSLLQSRPITSLFPLPEGLPPEPLRVMFSFGAVQGLLDPLTPIGQDSLRFVVAGAGRTLGYRVDYATQGVFRLAGERIWVDVTPVVRNGLGRRAARAALRWIEPSVGLALQPLLDDPRLAATAPGLAPGTILHLLPRLLPLLGRVLRYLIDPEGRRLAAARETEALLADLEARCQVSGDAAARLGQRVKLLRELSQAFPAAIPRLITGLVAGMISFNGLRMFSQRALGRQSGLEVERLVLEATRGLPNNVTTEMDLRLWETAHAIRGQPADADHFLAASAEQLAADYLAGRLPPGAQQAVGAFLKRYGARGLGEIDFGRPRWRDDPAPVMQALQSYLRITDESAAPDAVFARGAAAAATALNTLETAACRTHLGPLKARVIRFLGGRLRALMGLRESPKFFIIRLIDVLRRGLLASGQDYAQAGVLAQADDVVWLHLEALEALARGDARDWRGLIAARRAAFEREKRRRQIPRLLLSDGRAFHAGLGADDAALGLRGDPVSPGVAEGRVRVVLDPAGAQLAPGEILVCPGTDPSWTPLFLAAGGLVTEVGGLMTHGSVVAREYGIPAVVGVDRATQRLRTGQRVRLDGSAGWIIPLE